MFTCVAHKNMNFKNQSKTMVTRAKHKTGFLNKKLQTDHSAHATMLHRWANESE